MGCVKCDHNARNVRQSDAFNDIGAWDVSNVVVMSEMFFLSDTFNQYIGDWDVSSVTNMRDMFNDADAFNQEIGADVSNVNTMKSMFAQNLSRDISGWDVSNVMDMESMFYNADGFNQDPRVGVPGTIRATKF